MVSDRAYLTSKNENIKNDLKTKVPSDYHAELNGFNSNSGNETYDWMAAKAEIDHLLQNCKEPSVLLKKSKEVSDHWRKTKIQRKNRNTSQG